MIQEKKGALLSVRLAGPIDETVNFDELLGSLPEKVEINCKEITRFNSAGVKEWIKYFQKFQKNQFPVQLIHCSVSVVDQINLIPNFSCGSKIVSIYIPFCCVRCHCELVGLFITEDLKKIKFNLPPRKCIKCGGNALFDDVAEDYFSFLM